jgi:hypothetical protein
MSFDYAEIAADAQALLEEFGARGQIKRSTPGVYDPSLGAAPVTTTTQVVTAAVFAMPAHLIDGTTVLQGDEQAYMSALGITDPAPLDVLTWQGVGYTVISAKRLAPAGVAVLHELQVRR